MKFGYAIFEWIEAPKPSLVDLLEKVIDGEFPLELYLAICKAMGQCIGI